MRGNLGQVVPSPKESHQIFLWSKGDQQIQFLALGLWKKLHKAMHFLVQLFLPVVSSWGYGNVRYHLKWPNFYNMHSADWKSEERNVRSKAPWWTAGTVTFSGGGETAEETSREIRFGRNIQLPGSHWAFVYSAPGPHLHRDYCNFPLWKSQTKAPLPPSVTQILFWNAIKIFFVQAPLLGHTVYHVHSIYSWAFRGRRHMLRHPERWRLKSFKKKDGQTQKMHHTCYADSPKYKRKSRCERKQWVFSVPFILCCPSGFLLLRTPYHLQRWSFSRGARRLIYHSQREGGCCSLFQKKAIWNCQNTRKSCPLSSAGAVVMNERIRVAHL